METASEDFRVSVDEFHHQDQLLQEYRQIFLGGETFTAALAATQLERPGVVISLAWFGCSWGNIVPLGIEVNVAGFTSLRLNMLDERKLRHVRN